MPELASTSAFYASRPTITLDGDDAPALALGILSLAVNETVDGLYCAEITFGNWGSVGSRTDFLYFDRDLLDFGKELAITMGEGETAQQVFRGKITAIEGRFPDQKPPEILVLAEDSLQDLRMVRRSREFESATVSEVIESVAGFYNLTTDVEIDSTQFAVLTQVNQSDLAFLRECVRLVDAELWVEDNKIMARSRSARRHSEITFTYGQRLFEFSVMADLARQRTALEVCGWDVAAKSAVAEKADSNAIQSELDNGESGAGILLQTFGERVERVVHQVPFSNTEAMVMAHSGFRQIARQFLTGQAILEGDGRVRVGSQLRFEGIGPLFAGAYYVNRVRNSFDATDGFRTRVHVEKPGLGRV